MPMGAVLTNDSTRFRINLLILIFWLGIDKFYRVN